MTRAMPDPEIWPVCPEHHVPWVLRRCFGMGGSRWVWMSDCKKSCKATPELHDQNGKATA